MGAAAPEAVLTLPQLRALRLEAQLLRTGARALATTAGGGPAHSDTPVDPGSGADRATAASGPAVDTVVAVVERLVALQGQDLRAVQLAIAVRAGVGPDAVAAAFASGRIVRGWPMRGTLFVTTPQNLAALGTHTRKQAMSSVPRRREQLGITADLVERATEVGLARLADGPATRGELLDAWRAAGIDVDGQRGYHYIATLSQAGHWHWGAMRDREQELVASADAIVLATGEADATTAFTRILLGYLDGHGPATLADLAWWTKAPKTVLRRAIEAARDEVASVGLEGAEGRELLARPAHLAGLGRLEPPAAEEVHLLPAFDEYFLGYEDRSPVASAAVQAAVVPGGNGMFRPLVVSAGRVVGTWARGTRKSDPPAVVEFLEPVSAATRRAVDAAAGAVAV